MKHGFNDAIAKVGMTKFISDLFWVGMFYHLYNQVTQFPSLTLRLVFNIKKEEVKLKKTMCMVVVGY